MFTHRPSITELREEMKSLDIETLNLITLTSQQEFIKRYVESQDPHRELVIMDGKVRRLK